MLRPCFLLFGALFLQFSYEACAMDCDVAGAIISCPMPFMDSNKVFCCKPKLSLTNAICCDLGDYLSENTPLLAGILVGLIIILIIITICCCCFCSCCLLAKRRNQRGTVYGPIGSDQLVITSPPSISPYPLLHPPPASQYPPPPPYQPAINPNFNNAYYPSQNPQY